MFFNSRLRQENRTLKLELDETKRNLDHARETIAKLTKERNEFRGKAEEATLACELVREIYGSMQDCRSASCRREGAIEACRAMSRNDRDTEDSLEARCGEMWSANDEQPDRVAFNLEEWLQLARENPEEFERRREQLIRETVFRRNMENEHAHGSSRSIDMERKRYGESMDN